VCDRLAEETPIVCAAPAIDGCRRTLMRGACRVDLTQKVRQIKTLALRWNCLP